MTTRRQRPRRDRTVTACLAFVIAAAAGWPGEAQEAVPIAARAAIKPDAGTMACTGRYVVAEQQFGVYMHAVGLVPDSGQPDGLVAARKQAHEALRAKLCPHGRGCQAFEPLIDDFDWGHANGHFCAAATIRRAGYRALIDKRSAEPMQAALREAVADTLRQAGLGGPGKPRPRIAIGPALQVATNIATSGRSAWLTDRVKRAAYEAGAVVVLLPRDWTDGTVPRGVDLILRLRMTPRMGKEYPVVDVTACGLRRGGKGRRGGVFECTARPVPVPEIILPDVAVAPPASLPDHRPDLAIQTTRPSNGHLCSGDSAHLTLRSDTPRYVRIVNLYGTAAAGGALVIHPAQAGADGKVSGSVDLGDFYALPYRGTGYERYVVIAAKRLEDLGKLGKAGASCRLPDDLAQRAQADPTVLVPAGTEAILRGYEIEQSGTCKPLPAADEARLAQVLAGLPRCW